MEAVTSSVAISPSIVARRTKIISSSSRRRLHSSSSSSSSSSWLGSVHHLSSGKRWRWRASASARSKDDDEEEVERALGMDGGIPVTSDEFVRRVSSRAYDMRRHLNQSLDSLSYDVLETNPWRDDSKPVYVLTHNDNQLCTMKTRQNRRFSSDLSSFYVEKFYWKTTYHLCCAVKLKENLDCCFPKGGNGDWKLEARLLIQGMSPTLTCLLKILERGCLCLRMKMMPQNIVICYREEVKAAKALRNLRRHPSLISATG